MRDLVAQERESYSLKDFVGKWEGKLKQVPSERLSDENSRGTLVFIVATIADIFKEI
jgi:hypothetical protein